MDLEKTGEFLRALRKAKGLTQQEVADALYISQKTISRWESGMGFPDVSIIDSVANFYDITVDELFNGERKKENQSENTMQKKEQYKNKALLTQLSSKLNIYLFVSLGINILFIIVSILVYFLVNIFLSLLFAALGLSISLAIYIFGKKEINTLLDEASDYTEKKSAFNNKFKRKNLLFSDIYFTSICIYIFLFLYCFTNI